MLLKKYCFQQERLFLQLAPQTTKAMLTKIMAVAKDVSRETSSGPAMVSTDAPGSKMFHVKHLKLIDQAFFLAMRAIPITISGLEIRTNLTPIAVFPNTGISFSLNLIVFPLEVIHTRESPRFTERAPITSPVFSEIP